MEINQLAYSRSLFLQDAEVQSRFMGLSIAVAVSYSFFQIPDIARILVLETEEEEFLRHLPTQILVIVLYWLELNLSTVRPRITRLMKSVVAGFHCSSNSESRG